VFIVLYDDAVSSSLYKHQEAYT